MDSKTIKTTKSEDLIIQEVEQTIKTDQGEQTRTRYFVSQIKKVDPPIALQLHEFDNLEDAEHQVKLILQSRRSS